MKIINLLPKSKQEEFKYESIFHNLVILTILSLISFAMVFLVQIGVRFYLSSKVAEIDSQIQASKRQVDKDENAVLKKQIQDINDTVSDYKILSGASPKWSKVIKAFSPLPPPGVRITSMSVDSATKQMLIYGSSPTRELVIQLYNNILGDKDNFFNIDYPLENVARPTNITFHFTFKISDALLQ